MKIKFFSLIKLDLKKDEVDYQLSGSKSVKEIIKLLDQEFDNYFSRKLLENGELKSGTIVLLNGRNIRHLQGLDTLVENKDEITIFPPSGGG
ncbi:MoaD family protein [Petrotoga mobilis SJ95]|uniref:MoaD family protein n=1 Tax=Petrotoga mobilis (strain DSM 10674 / SJ95) TaxID=403833 RepID=A9BF62_PETMO|nr:MULTISPECIES: MoaD family protein [Petrotoga]ABX31126.1 MoaD family protein [Petrotoga mobilis SJ95]PNR87032.1 molybdenum biosynthesis protein MoaD [Petrotoga sp. 9T1HF07.CasAA.8.2]PNR94216.1 molybdenum biosynthesis protein MoaD [Petrotoga sp. HWHPT.55.6.3]RPD36350.1 molybdenum biosynthesis protein MoaD [Petrotoga sp. HWH.PT.55.6.1]